MIRRCLLLLYRTRRESVMLDVESKIREGREDEMSRTRG